MFPGFSLEPVGRCGLWLAVVGGGQPASPGRCKLPHTGTLIHLLLLCRCTLRPQSSMQWPPGCGSPRGPARRRSWWCARARCSRSTPPGEACCFVEESVLLHARGMGLPVWATAGCCRRVPWAQHVVSGARGVARMRPLWPCLYTHAFPHTCRCRGRSLGSETRLDLLASLSMVGHVESMACLPYQHPGKGRDGIVLTFRHACVFIWCWCSCCVCVYVQAGGWRLEGGPAGRMGDVRQKPVGRPYWAPAALTEGRLWRRRGHPGNSAAATNRLPFGFVWAPSPSWPGHKQTRGSTPLDPWQGGQGGGAGMGPGGTDVGALEPARF